MTNPLRSYFNNNKGRLIHKWDHYFDIYHRHFHEYRNQKVTILEFGVFHGGSLQMWKNYFGDQAQIIGVDINPICKQFEEDQISIEIGDQEDRNFLKQIAEKHGPFDIVIDDGGHQMNQQINTFEEIYPHVQEHGIFLVEDMLTSYRPTFNAGYKKPNTFIEYSKNFIDSLHAWHSHEPQFQPDALTTSAFGLHYYDSVLVIEKKPITQPWHSKTGTPSF